MIAIQKLTKNGNAVTVAIPRAILNHLGWLPSQWIAIALNEDNTVTVRIPTNEDLRPKGKPNPIVHPLAEVPK